MSMQVGSSPAEPQGKPVYTMGYYAAIKILFAKNKLCVGIPGSRMWWGLCSFTAKPPGLILVRELRSHKLDSIAKKKKN